MVELVVKDHLVAIGMSFCSHNLSVKISSTYIFIIFMYNTFL